MIPNGYYEMKDRMDLIAKVIATQQRNANADDGSKYLIDADMALEVIEDVLFARYPFDLELRTEEGWFGDPPKHEDAPKA
jgi:predicted metal-dependent HD superfamily phosphohydrolase